ncbi:MAG: CDP-archaeol synthase [Kiritimatiellae bacterium]|nr:CDP-archaeol synthase [Kiritimatiellia bacterium]
MLKHRIISGLLFAGMVIVLANYVPPVGAWLVLVFLSSVGQLEFYGMMDKAGIPVFRVWGPLCGAALISVTFCTIGPDPIDLANGYKWENMVLLGSLMIVFIRQFPQKNNPKPIATIACTLLGVWYVPFLMNYFTRIVFGWNAANDILLVGTTGRMLIVYLVLVVKLTDVGAFFVGRQFGKHKLFPRLSPKKTWEGLIGGVVTAVSASVIFVLYTDGVLGDVHMSVWDAVILGLLLSLVGVAGDLFESLMKRSARVKDSGNMVPGMGGVLDVLDSLLFGAPVLYAYAKLFL